MKRRSEAWVQLGSNCCRKPCIWDCSDATPAPKNQQLSTSVVISGPGGRRFESFLPDRLKPAAFHEYFRKFTPPLLVIWGKHDPYFVPAGAEAFRRDIPGVTVQFLDTGHFALETHVEEVAAAMRDFLGKTLG
ncbi:alpha/beta fold hydrolase [Acidicapsa acidisoli]|uniref:alpha/beta fold hydrolase n=1 Tax=Acidicapsa acidisoli TaxID=1615681 RepID=UPI0021E08BA3|nr:alpha/beta hydrolase [Acidicapsa acidisoli]